MSYRWTGGRLLQLSATHEQDSPGRCEGSGRKGGNERDEQRIAGLRAGYGHSSGALRMATTVIVAVAFVSWPTLYRSVLRPFPPFPRSLAACVPVLLCAVIASCPALMFIVVPSPMRWSTAASCASETLSGAFVTVLPVSWPVCVLIVRCYIFSQPCILRFQRPEKKSLLCHDCLVFLCRTYRPFKNGWNKRDVDSREGN